MMKTINKPIYSVVIPAYKRNDFVIQAMNSVLNQKNIDRKLIEVIISDDEDDPMVRAKNKNYFKSIYKDVVYTINKHEEGPGGNRQTGFEITKGKYIVFLDSDDRLKPNFLGTMSRILESGNFAAAVSFSTTTFNKGFKFKEIIKLIPLIFLRDFSLLFSFFFNNKTLIPSSFYLCQLSHVMFKKSKIYRQKFDYKYRHGGEDWNFFIQTLKNGPIRVVPKRLIYFRYSSGSSTDNPLNRKKKWDSYQLLLKNITKSFKKGLFYYLFVKYINLFGKK